MTTPTEIKTVIAERVMGWELIKIEAMPIGIKKPDGKISELRYHDFYTDLNAMHEASVRLSETNRELHLDYVLRLSEILREVHGWDMAEIRQFDLATPQQRATAMYEVLLASTAGEIVKEIEKDYKKEDG